MGYQNPRKRVRLRFPHHQGLEVVARSVPLKTFLKITRLAETAGAVEVGQDLDLAGAMAAVGEIEELFTLFGSALVEWNITDDDDEPIPCDMDGLGELDPGFALEIVHAWMEGIGGVSAPLARPSVGGDPSLAASLPMDVSSPSRAS